HYQNLHSFPTRRSSDLFAKYLDAGTFDSVDTDVLKEMEEEDEPVKYFLDRNNDLVFVIGTRAEVETNTFYGYVAADTKEYDTRGDRKSTRLNSSHVKIS